MMSIHIVQDFDKKGSDVADEKQAFLLVKHSFIHSWQLQYYPIALFSSAI